MATSTFLFVFFLLAPLPQGNREKNVFPQRPPPLFALVSKVDMERGEITLKDMASVPVQVEQQIVVNGQRVSRIVNRQELRITIRSISIKKTSIYSGSGKKLSKQEAGKLLKKGTTVLLSADGNLVDPLYLRALREDTLILVSPLLPVPGPKNPKKLPAP